MPFTRLLLGVGLDPKHVAKHVILQDITTTLPLCANLPHPRLQPLADCFAFSPEENTLLDVAFAAHTNQYVAFSNNKF